MVFNTLHTTNGNVARSHIRTLSMNPQQYNEPHFTKQPLNRQPLDTTVCLMCHLISHLKNKTNGLENIDTPCCTTKAEGCDGASGETDSPEKMILSLSKDMSEILGASCMGGTKDSLRETVGEIVNHTCKEWVGEDVESANIKAILHRVEFTSVEDGISEVFHVYQLALFVAVPGRSAAMMVPLCKDDGKFLVDQSYAFFVDHEKSVFTSHTYKTFDADKKMTSKPCVKWVNNIYKKLSNSKDASGRSVKLSNVGDNVVKKKKKKKRTNECFDTTEVVEAVVEHADPPKKKKKKKSADVEENSEETEGSTKTVSDTEDPQNKKKKTKKTKKSLNENSESESPSTEDTQEPTKMDQKKKKKKLLEGEATVVTSSEQAEPEKVKKKKKKKAGNVNNENQSPPIATDEGKPTKKKKEKSEKSLDEAITEKAPEAVDLAAVEEKKRRIKEIMSSS